MVIPLHVNYANNAKSINYANEDSTNNVEWEWNMLIPIQLHA